MLIESCTCATDETINVEIIFDCGWFLIENKTLENLWLIVVWDHVTYFDKKIQKKKAKFYFDTEHGCDSWNVAVRDNDEHCDFILL